MKTIAYLIIADLFISGASMAQTTITLQPTPSQGKDAMIYSCVPCGYVNNNYGTKKDFDAMAWTNSGNFGISRSLMQFDLSSIPANAYITDAKLSLYYNTTSAEGTHSGTNASYLQRITTPWYESTVTWTNQPPTTTNGQILLPTSTINTQNYLNINVTNFIRDMVINPGTNYGFMLRLVNETAYKKMIFASSDHITPGMRPKLDITYTTPLPVTLLNFDITTNNTSHELSWSTASEINNAGFEIERSESGSVDFEKIGFVPGNGTSNQVNYYNFNDKDVSNNTDYLYRLKQIDFDGRYNYSKILKSKKIISNKEITAGPNPFSETSTIYYALEESSQVKIDVFNSKGNYLATLKNTIQQTGSHELIFDPKSIGRSSGVYEIRILINDKVVTRRLIYTP